MIVAAIDPGVAGAVAFLDTETGGGWGEILDTTDAVALAELLRVQAPGTVAIEVPVGRGGPVTSRAAQASLWRAIGCAEGVVLALGLPLVRVQPKEWQRLAFAGRTKPTTYPERKRHALRLARERWPGARLDRVKDSGLADALWVAYAAATTEAKG